ncbi:MAG: 50S ribosomal protein L15 [Gammaproteobacteria bacterium]
MRLNTLSSPPRATRKRVGRGSGSGHGKTCGRGHKGQRSRSGARRDGNFEGGQMPLHRRVPKRGFNSRMARQTANVRLSDIARIQRKDAEFSEVTVAALKQKGIINKNAKRARLFHAPGGAAPSRAVAVSGVSVSKAARAAVEAAGGKINL